MRNERGWTRWDTVGIVVFVAFLVWMVYCGSIPPDNSGRDFLDCQNNLRQIGGLLMTREAGPKFRRADGAAFLLQIAGDVSYDEDLRVFLCRSERNPDPARPEPGTPEFVDLFRKVLPRDGPDARMCSYAGPDFTHYPDRPGDGPRIWACDRCRGGVPHHKNGLNVLWSNGKTEILRWKDIVGCDPEHPRVILGPDSPDPRLRTLFVGD